MISSADPAPFYTDAASVGAPGACMSRVACPDFGASSSLPLRERDALRTLLPGSAIGGGIATCAARSAAAATARNPAAMIAPLFFSPITRAATIGAGLTPAQCPRTPSNETRPHDVLAIDADLVARLEADWHRPALTLNLLVPRLDEPNRSAAVRPRAIVLCVTRHFHLGKTHKRFERRVAIVLDPHCSVLQHFVHELPQGLTSSESVVTAKHILAFSSVATNVVTGAPAGPSAAAPSLFMCVHEAHSHQRR